MNRSGPFPIDVSVSERPMNYHQACAMMAMELIPIGSKIEGREVCGGFIVPSTHEDIEFYFANWKRRLSSRALYDNHDDFDIIVVLDHELQHSVSIWELLG